MWPLLATGNVVHANLDGFSLASAGFSRHENGLIFIIKRKSLVRQRRCLIDVRVYSRSRVAFGVVPDESACVSVSDLFGVNVGEPLKGVDRNDDITSTSVGESLGVTILQVVQNSGLFCGT